jgi:hypothetical protein
MSAMPPGPPGSNPGSPPPGSFSGYQRPAPTLIRAVCGPLMLITLGVLLAVDHVGTVSFGRTWPVLLIVFGACKLIDFANSRPVV